VIRDAGLLITAGAIIGIPSALALTRLVKSFLYGISAQDPVTIIAGTTVLAAAAALACFVPARRATKVDPMAALRCE
jgi:putative ABC transport system permease protein